MKITNGRDVFEVTRGAFESIYKRQGFVPFVQEAETEPDSGPPEDEDLTDDEAFIADITVKPFSQWSNDELRRYAQLKGMPIPANAKQLRAAVQAAVQEAGSRQQEAAEEEGSRV